MNGQRIKYNWTGIYFCCSFLAFLNIMFPTVVFVLVLFSSVRGRSVSEFISRAEYEEMKLKFEERLSALETQKHGVCTTVFIDFFLKNVSKKSQK